ncbi:unnamed protein product [Phaeothamnion confervicola]
MPFDHMGLPTSYEVIRPVVEHEFFDHRSVPQLEAYVTEQVSTNTYDFEANKALLKLYQFFPDLCKDNIVALVLAKAFMNLPSTDMAALLCILPKQQAAREPAQTLVRCAEAMETARFSDFWGLIRAEEAADFVEDVPGFADRARRFVVGALAPLFQDVTKEYFEGCVGLSGEALAAFVAAHADMVRLDGDRVRFALNRYNQSQPKKFKEAVEFDKMLGVINRLEAPTR